MKVSVKEEPAWRRVLEIEVEASKVEKELDKVVEEFRRKLVLPGFRKGKVPPEVARRHLGQDLEGEVLRRILPQALEEAVTESELKVIGDPQISNLKFTPGEPLAFTATLEVSPEIEIQGYEGLEVTRNVVEVKDEEIQNILDRIREDRADLEEVDRPAQGKDVVVIRHRQIDPPPEGEEDPVEAALEVGGPNTPETFSAGLMGASVGEMKEIPLEYPADYPDDSLAGTTRRYHVTVVQVKEKIWPPLDDALAREVLGNEEGTLDDLKTRIRLNLEVEARMQSMRAMESELIGKVLEANPFDVPQGIVESTLDRIMEDVRKQHPDLPPDEESRARESYRPQVEGRYRHDILVDAVGRQEGIQVTEEDLDREIETFAENEGKKPAQVKARLRKEGGLDRLRTDLYRRRVLDRLVEKAKVVVLKDGQPVEEETSS